MSRSRHSRRQHGGVHPTGHDSDGRASDRGARRFAPRWTPSQEAVEDLGEDAWREAFEASQIDFEAAARNESLDDVHPDEAPQALRRGGR